MSINKNVMLPTLPEGPIVTVPTTVSTVGFGLVLDGVRRGIDTKVGLAETTAGRLGDLLDGF